VINCEPRIYSLITRFERTVVILLIFMMIATVALSTIELGAILVTELFKPPMMFLNLRKLFDVFGAFFMVLIGLELIETIKGYLSDNHIRLEIVFAVAMIAVCRKVIILDIDRFSPTMLLGIAALVLALATGFFLIRQTAYRSKLPEPTPPAPESGPVAERT